MIDDWAEKIFKGFLPLFLIGNTVKMIFQEWKKR